MAVHMYLRTYSVLCSAVWLVAQTRSQRQNPHGEKVDLLFLITPKKTKKNMFILNNQEEALRVIKGAARQ